MRLRGRVALVTGAGSGIGAETCRAFATEGALVAATDSREEAAEEVAEQIREQGRQAQAWRLDVCDSGETEQVAGLVESELGQLAIWVNNAGISSIVPFLDCTDELWDETLRVNLTGAFHGCQAALRRMVPRHSGVILNMSSQSGKVGASHYAAYCASKFGIIGLTESLALEFGANGIRVNALCPGVVLTPLWESMLPDYAAKRNLKEEEVIDYLVDRIPLGRLCTPQDVAQAAVFLASDAGSYITGQAINISGGAVMD
jgi:NAD(P)-dependent dehydrogenase (short-subunit alcohol dehydrogenase family)